MQHSPNKLENIPSLSDFIKGLNIPSLSNINIVSKNVSRAVVVNEYISPYPVISALDYNACLKQTGNQVEVIGKVVSIKNSRARNGKPYIFINFGDWRGNIFKITILSEGLAIIANKPDSSWVGKLLSIKGLMESPYRNEKFKCSSISITVSKKGQLFIINEVEAKKRLAAKQQSFSINNSSQKVSNQDILAKISGQKSSTKNSQPIGSIPPNTTNSSNQAILNKIHATTSNTGNSSNQRQNISPPKAQQSTANHNILGNQKNIPKNRTRNPINIDQVIKWTVAITIILAILKTCS